MCRPAISCTALFAVLFSWSGVTSPCACVSAGIGRRSLLAGIGMPEIISCRGSGIFLLWRVARWSRLTVVVIPASGFSALSASVVRSGIALRHTSWRSVSLSKSMLAGGIFFQRTSAMTDHHLLLAWLLPAKRKQEACQKCRRHGDSVHRPVRIIFWCSHSSIDEIGLINRIETAIMAVAICIRMAIHATDIVMGR